MTIKAVLFDIGGVVVGSPITGIRRYESRHGLPHDYINVGITAQGDMGAFQRLERGELTLSQFFPLFGQGLSDTEHMNAWYRQHCLSRGTDCPRLPQKLSVDGKELWTEMMAQAACVHPDMERALICLRSLKKYRLAALTNNHAVDRNTPRAFEGPPRRVREYFDEFIESSVVGLRKPDVRIFEHTIKTLGVSAHEIVFLDDIGMNLKAARKLGMHTIRVHPGDERRAVLDLERKLGERLLSRM